MILQGKLKQGFTTGTCAQAAAKASSLMLATKRSVKNVEVETPKGIKLNIKITCQRIGRNFAECAVIKDSGDDPDVTNGARICAKVRYHKGKGIFLKGAKGVGIVTKPGLAVKVGEYAINPTPRRMIIKEVAAHLPGEKGIEVIISVPAGRRIAKRTFNSRLGIIGGISIIGTTGIVEPKSTDAYKKSLSLQLGVLKAAGFKKAVLVLGYVGEKFCQEALGLKTDSVIKIGDHVGFMLSECVKKKIKNVLLVGHIGKLVKVANGQFDTNIKFGDQRLNTITGFAGLCGAKNAVIQDIARQISAEAAIDILKEHELSAVFDMIAEKTVEMINGFVKNQLSVKCILLSLRAELLSSYPKRAYKRG